MMKKMLKNQKGLTLIELLAVVVILGIIAAIAIPAIGGLIDNSKKDAHAANAIQMINAAKLAVVGDDRARPDAGDILYISLGWLTQEGYLEPVIDPDKTTSGYDLGDSSGSGTSTVYDDPSDSFTSGSYVKVTASNPAGSYTYAVFTDNGDRGVYSGDTTDIFVDEADVARSKVQKTP